MSSEIPNGGRQRANIKVGRLYVIFIDEHILQKIPRPRVPITSSRAFLGSCKYLPHPIIFAFDKLARHGREVFAMRQFLGGAGVTVGYNTQSRTALHKTRVSISVTSSDWSSEPWVDALEVWIRSFLDLMWCWKLLSLLHRMKLNPYVCVRRGFNFCTKFPDKVSTPLRPADENS